MLWVSGGTWSGGQSSYSPELVVGWLVLNRANQKLNGLTKTPKEKVEEAKPQRLPVSEPWFSLITGAWVCLLAFWLESSVKPLERQGVWSCKKDQESFVKAESPPPVGQVTKQSKRGKPREELTLGTRHQRKWKGRGGREHVTSSKGLLQGHQGGDTQPQRSTFPALPEPLSPATDHPLPRGARPETTSAILLTDSRCDQ